MRPAVHPDHERCAIFPRANRVRHDVALHRLGVGPDLQAERTLQEIEDRQPLALPLDHLQLRFVVAERADAPFLVERNARVINGHRVAAQILTTRLRPGAGKLRLRKRRRRQHEGEYRAEHAPERVGAGFSRPGSYQALHGVGSHFDASVSFLKCELTMYGRCRYCASSTTVVTIRSWPLPGSGDRSKYSVTVAFSL